MSNFTAIFRLKASDDGMSGAIDKANKKMGTLGGGLAGGMKGMLGNALSLKGGMDILKGSMEEVLNRAKQYNNLGKRMGIPAVEVQKLDKAAEAAGINVASLSRSMSLLQKYVGDAMGGSAEKTNMLRSRLGATDEQLRKMSLGGTEGLATMADLLANVGDEAERDYIGSKMLGEKWNEMKGFIGEGGDAVRKAGGGQTTWSESTQESLTRVQKAWANMWNDISVSAAELIELLEPFIGILRIVANILMGVVRIAIFLVAQAFDGLKVTILSVLWAMLATLNFFSGGKYAGELKKLEKQIDESAKKIEERNEKLGENLKKDVEGMGKGALMVVGIGDEAKAKKTASPAPLKKQTVEEEEALNKALEKQKEINSERELAAASELEQVEILGKQYQELKKLEELERANLLTYEEKYRNSAKLLDILNKEYALKEKIAKLEIDNAKKAYDFNIALFEASNDRKIKNMEKSGATEGQIFEEKMRQQKELVVRLSKEMEELDNNKFATQDDRRKKMLEIGKAAAKAQDMMDERQKKDSEGPKVTASSMRAFGGGGGVFVANIAEEQLGEQKQTNEYLRIIAETATAKSVGGFITGGVVAPQIGNSQN